MKKFLLFAAAAMMAASASAATQQNVIAEMYPGSAGLIGWGTDNLLTNVTEDGRDALKVTNTEKKDFWAVQIAYDTKYEIGTTYYFTFDVKGDAGKIGSGFQCTDGYIGCGDLNSFSITGEWNTVTISGTVTDPGDGKEVNRWVASVGDYVGTFFISNMKLYTVTETEPGEEPETPATEWVSLITGGNAADGQTNSIRAGWSGNAPVVANPAGEGKAFEAPIAANPENAWDSQLFIVFNEPVKEGAKVKISFDYYCTDERTIDIQAHGEPGAYHHYYCGIPALKAKPEWQSVAQEITVTSQMTFAPGSDTEDGFKTLAFNLASAPAAASFYINNVVIETEKKNTSDVKVVVVPVEKARTVVYNLLGVKVLDTDDAAQISTLKKGIYVVNGKKVAIR